MKMKESKSIRDLSTHNKREYITTIPKKGNLQYLGVVELGGYFCHTIILRV
jgi:hypothetical protein